MSLLIKDAEMPKTCSACPCSGYLGECRLANGEPKFPTFNEWYEEKPSWCPLVEVPEHGRLIDADALMLSIQEYIDEYGWDVDEHGFHSEKWCAMKETEMAINDAPTVIPASDINVGSKIGVEA